MPIPLYIALYRHTSYYGLTAPPFAVPAFFEDVDDGSGNMVQLFGLAANYSADFLSGVRGADRFKMYEWYAELMEGDNEDFRRGMRLNRKSFDFFLRKVTPYLLTERDGPGKPRIDVEKRVAATTICLFFVFCFNFSLPIFFNSSWCLIMWYTTHHMSLHTIIHARMYMCMYVCMYVYMSTCVCVVHHIYLGIHFSYFHVM